MRIGAKSRYLLELIAALGLDAIEGLHTIPQIHRMINCSSERNYLRRVENLRESGLIEFEKPRETGSWVPKLTRSAMSALTDDLDPVKEWESPWDGYWRLFAFDLPTEKGKERQILRRWLKRNRLGKLQGSLWITPKNVKSSANFLESEDADPSAVVLFKGKCEGTHSNSDYVNTAWTFTEINDRYDRYLEFLKSNPPESHSIESLSEWFQKEVKIWREAFDSDPFLPRVLWSKEIQRNYLGPKALSARKKAYTKRRKELFRIK